MKIPGWLKEMFGAIEPAREGRYGVRGGTGPSPRAAPPAPADAATSARPLKAGRGALTTDPLDPRLGHGVDTAPVQQHETYLVLSEDERRKGFVRPLRRSYVHVGIAGTEQSRGASKAPGGHACGVQTRMGLALCETYARQPDFYGATYCVGCSMHLPVDEFVWDPDGARVGS